MVRHSDIPQLSMKSDDSRRWLFIIEGAITIVVAFISIFILPNFPRTTPWLTEEEKDLAAWRLEEDIGEDDWVNSEDQSFLHGAKLAFTDLKTWVLVRTFRMANQLENTDAEFYLDADDPLYRLFCLRHQFLPHCRANLELRKYRNPSPDRTPLLSRCHYGLSQRLALGSNRREILSCYPAFIRFRRCVYHRGRNYGYCASVRFDDAHGAIFLFRIRRCVGLDFEHSSPSCVQACCCTRRNQLRQQC